MAPLMPQSKLNNLFNSIFSSKLHYYLSAFFNVWYKNDMDKESRRYAAFTKQDLNKLPSLTKQNNAFEEWSSL